MPPSNTPLDAMTSQRTLYDYPDMFIRDPKGEGCCSSTAVARADAWVTAFCENPAKSGIPPTMGRGPTVSPKFTSAVHKRSYRRACRRALRDGRAGYTYHGRVLHLRDFPDRLIHELQRQDLKQTPLQTNRLPSQAYNRHSRIQIFHWNPGGMAQGKFLEFKWWLRNSSYDMVVLTETRWSFDNQWADDHWSYIHSSSKERQTGGILIMISKRLARSEMLGFDPIIPGRLVHVRIHFERRAIDLLTTYQHVARATSASRDQRQTLWTTMDQTLSSLPNRNLLLCVGDYNCTLPQQAPWTGSPFFRWQGHRCQGHIHHDQMAFMDVLQRHGLTSLTSWSEATGPSFVHGKYATRIDHVMIRLANCDGIAKQAEFLPHAEFLPMNDTHHVPFRCSVRSFNMAFQVHQPVTSCSYPNANNVDLPGFRILCLGANCRQRYSRRPTSQNRLYPLMLPSAIYTTPSNPSFMPCFRRSDAHDEELMNRLVFLFPPNGLTSMPFVNFYFGWTNSLFELSLRLGFIGDVIISCNASSKNRHD